jgi:hypothetical protein
VWDSHGYFWGRQVTEATVTIAERPWERVVVDGKPHSHGETSFSKLMFLEEHLSIFLEQSKD